ncbi:MAG: Gfo/Idh/MocA family oxidoreductase [Burkholderiaceae bacterium]
MTKTLIGIIGCGNISDAYFKGAARSSLVQVKACADLYPEAAQAKATLYGATPMSVPAMLADPEITLVVNLTVPLAHAAVSQQIVEAGKSVYSEKPLAARFVDALAVMQLAQSQGVRVGCAPDTFMGASHQACRRALDAGLIGSAVGGAAVIMGHGAESWHPNPEFFYKAGGGPVLDMGPYYVTQLVNLLGPVRRVAGLATVGNPTRTITSEPLKGTTIQVDVPTTVNGLLEFACGANVSLSASWDVWKHNRVSPIEIYGTEGTLLCPDPNFFGNTPHRCGPDGTLHDVDITPHPFGIPNRGMRNGTMQADYRMIGLVDMAVAMQQGRSHRASGALALHVLEVLEALIESSSSRRFIDLTTSCERPEPVPLGADESVFA